MSRIITLTTDFGNADHYVGTVKGVMLNINPAATLVDVCNSVPAYDVLAGALTLAQAYSFFPAGTIHVVVVDPGVGSARRAILADTGKYLFVAPDNGVLSLVYEREPRLSVRHITAEHYFLQPVSSTFHGRDVFAPIAAHLSKGVQVEKMGEVIGDYRRFAIPRPKTTGANSLQGVVIKVDTFGNLVTNIRPHDLPQVFVAHPGPGSAAPAAFRVLVGKGEVRTLRSAFAEAPPGEVFAILGSMGYVEIASNRGSAAQALAAGKGSEVTFEF